MNDQEIIEARAAYERAVWDVLHAALPPEVDAALREWQRPS